jgi:aminocarboxymuconate-semialdehyde decarboxylase
MAQRTVDVHNHLYPKEYLAYLAGRKGQRSWAEQTGPNSYLLWDDGVVVAHIDRAGHYDPAARIADLDKAGLDTQIISKTIPDPSALPKDEGIYWAKKVNDHYKEVADKYPHRIYTMACLPYQAPDEACKELERCIGLGVKGIQMFSNCNGDVMFDPKFDGIFKLANDNNLPILIHPTVPLTKEAMKKSRIPYQLYGYTVDTSLCAVGLVFNGVFQKHKNLRAVHVHLGGVVPYLVRRLRDSWKGYAKEWGLSLDENPADTYAKRIYPDTASFYLPSMKACLEWVGPNQIALGTDYAHRVGDPEGAIKAVVDLGQQANLSQDQVDRILGKNMEELYKLPPIPANVKAPVNKNVGAAAV